MSGTNQHTVGRASTENQGLRRASLAGRLPVKDRRVTVPVGPSPCSKPAHWR